MRFCLDARTATEHFPGIGRYVSNLAQAMVAQLANDETLLLIVDRSRPSTWQLPHAQKNVKIIETTISPFSLSQQWHIPKRLKQENADVYHSPYYLMPYLTGLPTAVTIHDLIPQLFPDYFPAKTRRLSSLFKRLAISRATAIVTDSQATRQDVLTKYKLPPTKVTAVPLAADNRFIPQSQTEIKRVRQKFNLSEAYILYLGINKPHKNITMLVEAYIQLAEQRKTVPQLVIAGAWDGRYPEAKELAQQSNVNHLIHFPGPIPDKDLPALYSGALFFVFPSLYEGFGLPPIEAMACGTAVVCANSASLVEVAGEAALTFDPNHKQALVSHMRQFLDDADLIKTYEQRSLKQASSFSWQKTAVATLNCYRSIIQ